MPMVNRTDARRRPRLHAGALSPFVVVAALSFGPTQAHAQVAGDRKTATIESTVDTTIKPGDDFFAYANGSWLKATVIPAGKDRWGAREEINDVARRRLTQLLEDANGAPRGSIARKVADFRTALMNEEAIQAKGIASLKPYLDSIDRVKDKTALTRLLGRGMRADVDPLNWGIYKSSSILGLSVEPSIHGEKIYVAFLVQGGLGLPDREDYLTPAPSKPALRPNYRVYIGRLLSLAGFDNADRRADAVIELETEIARTHATREASANDHNADTVWSQADFARNAPGMDWSAFFAAAGLAKLHAFVPWQPTAVKGVAALVASQSIETWKDYLRVRALDEFADALPAEFAREASAFRSSTAGLEAQKTARAQRAMDLTQLAMSDAIGRMYAERYFPAAQKARVQKIVAEVCAAFARRVDGVAWMSPATKAIARQKLKALYLGIGYPERWPDYSDLVVDPADAVGNLRRVADRKYRHAVSQLGKPVDAKQWWIAPQTAGAILVFQQNAYEFTAALLQPPKFDPMASDAAAYGAIGAIIGHDIVHYVDVLGAEYDVDGTMRHWWTADDVKNYETVTTPLVNQFAAYRPFPDVAINGKLTLRENVADLAGLTAAFDAYRRSLGGRAADKANVRKSDREFFIAFAQGWRGKLSDSAMRAQAATNDHAPDAYRVATVRNLDAWYDAFDVRPGQRLYLEPSARVRIW